MMSSNFWLLGLFFVLAFVVVLSWRYFTSATPNRPIRTSHNPTPKPDNKQQAEPQPAIGSSQKSGKQAVSTGPLEIPAQKPNPPRHAESTQPLPIPGTTILSSSKIPAPRPQPNAYLRLIQSPNKQVGEWPLFTNRPTLVGRHPMRTWILPGISTPHAAWRIGQQGIEMRPLFESTTTLNNRPVGTHWQIVQASAVIRLSQRIVKFTSPYPPLLISDQSTYTLKPTEVMICAGMECDLLEIENDTISTPHLYLQLQANGSLHVYPIGRNSTLINQTEIVSPVICRSGDQVRCGRGPLLEFAWIG